MTGGNEIRVKAQTGSQPQRDVTPEIQVRRPTGPLVELAPGLSDVQRQVLECLQEAGKSLTVKQLEARVLCPSEALQEALDLLVKRRLVARLNTIIPSYSGRSPGVEAHTE
ncbi:MAG: hypothetical protein A2Y74_07460 [Actinobacteria bacterium RBG_13_63_9]|nr:MAG: hypothetical protein A2Y74_07460 [Actinobacteria bacterium RBG_13_63_9]